MSFGGFGAASTPSLFGAAGSGQSQPSLFGATPQSQANVFGQQQSGSGFGSLGGASSSQSQASLFGSAPQLQPSLFGSAPQSQPSLFGAAPQSQSSVFGSAFQSQPSLFGAAPQSQSSLFGNAPQSQPTLFGGQQQQQQEAQMQQMQQMQLPRALMDVIERLNPTHPESPFHAALYNIVSPVDVPRYSRPQGMDEKLWDESVSRNPDPSRLVPVQANMFDDLLLRSDMQERRLAEHAAVLTKIEQSITQMDDSIESEIRTKLAAYRRRHRELARKLLRIASMVELAASRNDSSGALSQAEIDQKRRLDTIARALAAPAVFKDKLSDLVELAESTVLERRAHTSVDVRDPRAANAIKTLLSDQLAGIRHLGDVCQRADRDLTIIAQGVSDR